MSCNSSSSSVSCSSRSSHTTTNNDDNDDSADSDRNSKSDESNSESDDSKSNDSNSSGDTESTFKTIDDDDNDDDYEEEEILNAVIYKFPVEVIMLERCTKTLDWLMVNDILSDGEWEAALMQIVITLATYQKYFHLRTMTCTQIMSCLLTQIKNTFIIFSTRNITRFRRLVEFLKSLILVDQFTNLIQILFVAIVFIRAVMLPHNITANHI